MNKQNKILLGLLAFVVACTIGYALFSETITINGTATAKGDFKLVTTCQAGLESNTKNVMQNLNFLEVEGGYKNDACSVNGNIVTSTVSFNYPSGFRYFTIAVENTGSIEAEYNVNSVDNNFTKTIKTYSLADDTLISSAEPNSGSTIQWWAISPVTIKKSDGTFTQSFEDILDDETGIITLKPGETLYFAEMFNWPRDVSVNGQYYKADATVTLPFEQVKAQ